MEGSECWRFYAVLTARVIFTASFDVSSLSREHVWTFSVLGDRIYEMRCLFVAVGLNTRLIVLSHWDNMSHAHPPSHIILTPGQPVMFRGPHFIISTMQAWTTPIFKVFGMTGNVEEGWRGEYTIECLNTCFWLFFSLYKVWGFSERGDSNPQRYPLDPGDDTWSQTHSQSYVHTHVHVFQVYLT